MLEPARLPERPISPNRRQIDAMGALGGLALGLGLVLVVDYRDRASDRSRRAQCILAAGPRARADDDGRDRAAASSASGPACGGRQRPGAGTRHRLEIRSRGPLVIACTKSFLGSGSARSSSLRIRASCFTPRHREALVNLEFGIESRKGVVVLIGEAGMGKTTVTRAVIEKQHGREVKCVYLYNRSYTSGVSGVSCEGF